MHSIKVIVVKKNKLSVPRPEEVYDFRNEPSNEEELRAYQTMFGMREDEKRHVGSSSTQPSPPPPTSLEEEDSSPSQPIEDQVQDLTMRFDAFWDETQEHQVSMSQEMEELRSKMNTMLSN